MTFPSQHQRIDTRHWRPRIRSVAISGFLAGATALLLAASTLLGLPRLFESEHIGVPVPSPVYAIESVSGTHTASLLNLPLGQPGLLQAPIPVDIDGDLLPDVTASVNLVNVEGTLQNPPNVNDVIAPNVEIKRLITAPVLGQAAKPLAINVKLTVTDLEGGPSTVLRFGYDTGLGGSIPVDFKAVLGGLSNFFNPLTATIDTTGGYIGLNPGLHDLGVGPASSAYEGPLTIIGGVERADVDVDARLEYSPIPDRVRIGYAHDEQGMHLSYAHSTFSEVDLQTDLTLASGSTTTDLSARVDRLPRQLAVDILATDDGRGDIDYVARSDGRAPDIGIDLAVDTPGEPPLRAAIDIEDLPRRMRAAWDAPQGGPLWAEFDSSGQGIGAVEATIATYDGAPTSFIPFNPSRDQYLNVQGNTDGSAFDEFLITGRLERIRHAELEQTADGGFAAALDVGDGAEPLEANLDLDLRDNGLPKVNARATIAPLPDELDLALVPAGTDQLADPLTITYDASEPVDIDLTAELILPDASPTASCSDPGTVCAALEARNVPGHFEARVADLDGETRIDVDAEPRPGGAFADLRASVVLGAPDDSNPLLAAPIIAEAEVLGLPTSLRARTIQNDQDSIEQFEFYACDRDYDTDTCSSSTVGDTVGSVSFAARNFTEADRPADLPTASPLTPLYVTASARGLPNTTDLVLFEATGRFADIGRIRFANVDDVLGVSTDIGGGQDFSTIVDVQNVDLPGLDGGRIDIAGDILLMPLPQTVDLCVGGAGRDLGVQPLNTTTAPCEGGDPFGDGSVDESPLSLALRASEDVDLHADLRFESEGDENDPSDDVAVAAQAELTNVPGDLTALVQSPEPGADGPLRLLTSAPGANDFDAEVAAQFTSGGADCDDPEPGGGDVNCLDVSIDDLPTHMTAYVDTSQPGEANVQMYACDYIFDDEECRQGTAGEIGHVAASARLTTGEPGPLPVREPAAAQHLVLLADQEIDDDTHRDLRAKLALDEVRALAFHQTPDGFDGHTDLGDNITPLEVIGYLETRNGDADEGSLIDARSTVSPLPQRMAFSQHGPGEDQEEDPLVITYESSATVDVVIEAEIYPALGGDRCGAVLTVCATVEIDDIPEYVRAAVSKVNGSIDDYRRPSATAVDLELVPDDPQSPDYADVRADGILGPDLESPQSPPLYLATELVDAPRYTAVRLDAEESLIEVQGGYDVESSAVERFRFHACRLDVNDTCESGTEGRVGELTVGARTFDLRPAEFPPPDVAAPLYASITQRPGALMEATARITDVEEVQYLNRDGVTGLRSISGANQDLAISVDLEGLPMTADGDTLSLGELELEEPRLSLTADVAVTPLPGELDVCLRQAGISPVPQPSGPSFTEPCENPTPFGAQVALDQTPASIAYRASTGFDTELHADATITGIDEATEEAADPHRFTADVVATQLPADLDVHVLSPVEREVTTSGGTELQPDGPLRALIDAPGASGTGPTIELSGASLIGEDAVCKDARATVAATCFSGRLVNLPTRTEVLYDPTIDPFSVTTQTAGDNLVISTDGTGVTDFEDLALSSVRPERDGNGNRTGHADVLVVDADLLGIPKPLEVLGRIGLPEDPEDAPGVEFLVQDDKAIDEVNAQVQNFIAPDPTLGVDVPDRPVGASSGPADQHVTLIQRGEAFRLDALIRTLRGAAFRTTRSTTDESMGTQVLGLDFGDDQDIRAFIDLQSDATSRIIGDVLIEDMAAGVDACFRSAYTRAQAALTPDDPDLYCDSAAVSDEEGAFELFSTPQGLGDMDVDAFLRTVSGGGSTILSSRVNIENVPEVVRGRFPSGDDGETEIAAFEAVGNGLEPDGIDQIVFEAASFDLADADTGYTGTLPYQPRPRPGGVFPAKAPPANGNQYVHATLSTPDFHVRGQVGKVNGGPSSQLQRILLSPDPCAAPEASQGNPSPPDYPLLPDDGVTEYTCVRADFDSDDEDPLELDLVVDGPEQIRLHDAGITDVPDYLQATLATTSPWLHPTLERGWRRPCGRATDEPANTIDCMAPMLRVDQPTADSTLYGILDVGTPSNLAHLIETDPALQLADLDALPETGWGDWGADPEGVRVQVGTFSAPTDDDPAATTSAIRAGIRLDIPRSLTVDQIQTYRSDPDLYVSGSVPNANPPAIAPLAGQAANDIRFRYAVRDGNGGPVNSIGELTGMIHDFVKQEQVLISAPCGTTIVDADAAERPLNCPEYGRGLPIPGELGLQLYLRKEADDFEFSGDDYLRNTTFVHLDGRASGSVDAGIRMVPADGPSAATDGVGLIEASIHNTPTGTSGPGTNPLEPSFRLRAEITSDTSLKPPGAVTFFPAISNTEASVNTVFADFDFSPTANQPARRVDALIHLQGATKVAAELKGFSTVTGSTLANFSAAVAVDIDPLNLELQSELSFNFSVREILLDKLSFLGLAGDVIATIIGGLADFILTALEEILNRFPVLIRMEAGLLAQFQIDELSRFAMRLNLLHAEVEKSGPGSATIGPMNLEMRTFRSGLVFKDSIRVPSPLDVITNGDIDIEIPLLTIEYNPGLDPILGANTRVQFRKCGAGLSQFNPFPQNNDNQMILNTSSSADFIIYPMSDWRYQFTALGFLPLPVFDIVLDMILGPIFCSFDPNPSGTLIIDQDHPGVRSSFPDHPLPELGVLPANPVPSTDPPPGAPPAPPAAGPPPPLPIPDPPAPRFTGPVATIANNQALCGTHTFDELTIDTSATVTVATTPNSNTSPDGSGEVCPSGEEGGLTFQANRLVVDGSIVADGVVDTFPFTSTSPIPASGTSGGGHGGTGGDGTNTQGGQAYGNTSVQPSTFGGTPGAGTGAGAGGGAIRLVGDDEVIVAGTLSADGSDGGDDGAPGACDTDPYDGNPNGPLADPPYEHTGPTGAGGGSGGGIVISATRVDLAGATVTARGGAGGDGLIGAGGGGGGGIVKVVAPSQIGIGADVSAGSPGGGVCPDVTTPTQAGDGRLVQGQDPHSELLPFQKFWYAAGSAATSPTFDGWVDAATQDSGDGVSIVTCAVTLPILAGPPDPDDLRPLFTMPANQPDASTPCGSGGPATVELGRTRVLDRAFTPDDPEARLELAAPAVNQYLGTYTVALRPQTPNNDCLDPGDISNLDDDVDCLVERFPVEVDAVIGIDASRPTIDIVSPTAGPTPRDTVNLALDPQDQPDLSGIGYLECKTTPMATYEPCHSTTAAFQLLQDGPNTISVRAHDRAGNVSLVDAVTVTVDRDAPTATATISPPDGTNGWHTTPPAITINGHSEPTSAGPDPYAYRFDNGTEATCSAQTCTVPPATIEALLPGGHRFHFTAIDAAGNRLYDDLDEATESPMQRPSPNDEFDFRYDPLPPQVAIGLVPPADRTFSGNDWFDTRPFVAAGAIDQVGASGVNQVTHDFGDGNGPRVVDDVRLDLDDGNGFVLYDPFDPPRLPDGTRTVCARATDVAGNVSTDCEDVRVDSTAPTGAILVDGNAVPVPDGNAGWFVTTPSVDFDSYNDGAGVGAAADRFRYRVDNDEYSYCDAPCSVVPGLLDTGRHLVHLAPRDRFDNVAVEDSVELRIDLEAPETITVITPEPAAGLNSWHLQRPYVRLFADDQDGGSGVEAISYSIDAGPTSTYAGPFRVPRGDHELCVWATDVAGNAATPVCTDLAVDLDEPTVTIGVPTPGGSGGWHVSPTMATPASSDAIGDAGVDQGFDVDLGDLCDQRPHDENPLAPSGTCVSVDGRPFTPASGPITIGEGEHTVRAYAIDVAGRRSPVTTRVVKVDLSAPVTTARFVPPEPARGPWYRTIPEVHVGAIDGDQSSGVDTVETSVGSNPFAPYTGPFTIGAGITTLDHRATDVAGLVGGTPSPLDVLIDLVPPAVTATQASPQVLVRSPLLYGLLPGLIGAQSSQLGWTITEDRATTVQVGVIIHDLLGNVVRRLDGGTLTVTPGVPTNGSTTWDGRDRTLLNLVPLGIYYYRVVATDEAGNVAHSGESRSMTLRASVCLPFVGCI